MKKGILLLTCLLALTQVTAQDGNKIVIGKGIRAVTIELQGDTALLLVDSRGDTTIAVYNPAANQDTNAAENDLTADANRTHNWAGFALDIYNIGIFDWSTSAALGRTTTQSATGASYSLINSDGANANEAFSLGNGAFNLQSQSATGVRAFLGSTGSANFTLGVQNTGGATASFYGFNNSPTDYGVGIVTKDVTDALTPDNAILTWRDLTQDKVEFTRWGITATAPADGDYNLRFLLGQATFIPVSSSSYSGAREGLIDDSGYAELGGETEGAASTLTRRGWIAPDDGAGVTYKTSSTGTQDIIGIESTLNTENDYQGYHLKNGDDEQAVFRMNGSRFELGSTNNTNSLRVIIDSTEHSNFHTDRLHTKHPIQMEELDLTAINNIGSTRHQIAYSDGTGDYPAGELVTVGPTEIMTSLVRRYKGHKFVDSGTVPTPSSNTTERLTLTSTDQDWKIHKVHYTLQAAGTGTATFTVRTVELGVGETNQTLTTGTIAANEVLATVTPTVPIPLTNVDQIRINIGTLNGGGHQGLDVYFELVKE